MNILSQPNLQGRPAMGDYDLTHREITLAGHAEVIRKIGKRAVHDVIEIGRRLSEAKKICGHGKWLSWLEREFGWTDRTALNFIQVHELAHSENFSDLSLPVSGLYLLAKPSTPKEVRTEIIARAEGGEALSVADIQSSVEAVKKANAAAKAAADRAELSAARPPTSRSAPKPQPLRSKAQMALAEFKVAVDIWFSKMDDEAKREAVEYVSSAFSSSLKRFLERERPASTNSNPKANSEGVNP